MKVDNPTTVRLDKKALRIKAQLAPIYGLKNILSTGLWLLDNLSAQDQKEAINRSLDPAKVALSQMSEEDFHKRILDIVREAQATPVKKTPARQAKSSKSA